MGYTYSISCLPKNKPKFIFKYVFKYKKDKLCSVFYDPFNFNIHPYYIDLLFREKLNYDFISIYIHSKEKFCVDFVMEEIYYDGMTKIKRIEKLEKTNIIFSDFTTDF